ncbi:tRNA A64-2'-O-ribosylphosphate transferase isoform X1 [Typha latifolia]|uniref:tRNA A64-2'-O-ribosylphosphate transferase isoform X1 n=1 Tax=Typha latifolia TaxID=4733 RepID=UPI003C2F0A31
MAAEQKLSIYKAARCIKRSENSLYNALRSIYEDSTFVSEIAALWPDLPLLANLRCGLWYSPRFDSTCYFKSTDGHNNNWSFSTSRLNLHVAQLAGQRGGCIIVDSTRKGKRFPDSMSKTIPIWACVLNRAIKKHLQMMAGYVESDDGLSSTSSNEPMEMRTIPVYWDSSLHLPLWVLDTEKAAIERRLDEWTEKFELCGADIASLAFNLKKPLRPLWISQKSLIWINDIPDSDSWDFTPIILLSSSAPVGIAKQRTSSEFSWHYIPGAGDDEESWARGLSPKLFWKHAFDIIDAGPDLCKHRVTEIVEKERVYHAQRGEYSPQVAVKPSRILINNEMNEPYVNGESTISCQFRDSDLSTNFMSVQSSNDKQSIFWLASTNLAVASTLHVTDVLADVDCVLNCDSDSNLFPVPPADSYLHLPILNSKVDRFSLFRNLPSAIDFAKLNLPKGKKLLVCCHNGEDISVCVCLAILTFLFDGKGSFDSGKSFMHDNITKWEMRKRLVFICKFAINARPSRGNLKQVFGFLRREEEHVVSVANIDHDS